MLIDALIGLNIIIPITIKMSAKRRGGHPLAMTSEQIRHELTKLIASRFDNNIKTFAEWFKDHVEGCQFVSSDTLHSVITSDLDWMEQRLRGTDDSTMREFYWEQVSHLQELYRESATPAPNRRWYIYDGLNYQYRPVTADDLRKIKRLVARAHPHLDLTDFY